MTVSRIGVTLALTLSALLTGSCSGCSSTSKAAPAVTADRGAPAEAVTPPTLPVQGLSADPLENAFRAIEDGERDAARDRWDPAYVVARVGRDPDALASWVRGQTTWIPYTGVLRGPVGVLLDRQGNSLDRALLLAALLKEAGHTVRLARAELPETARGLLAAILANVRDQRSTATFRRSKRRALTRPTPELAIQLDAALIERVLADRAAAADRVGAAIEERTFDHAERLMAIIGSRLPDPDWDDRLADARRALGDHWWVQRQTGATWQDWTSSRTQPERQPQLASPPARRSPPTRFHQRSSTPSSFVSSQKPRPRNRSRRRRCWSSRWNRGG